MITLYVDKGKAYVWNAEDWHTIRSQHRICGSLIGAIASFPRQNEFQGLPMALMPEEAALLVEKQICKLIELPNINSELSAEEKQAVDETELRLIQEQRESLRNRKIEQLSQKIDLIVEGKKKKMLSKGINNLDVAKETLLQEEIQKLPEVAPAHLLVHLPTEHHMTTELKEVQPNTFIQNILKKGANRYLVFKDLWEKGNYITSGSKFGCDFLIYPGDPVKFHASYMVRCVVEEKMFRPPELVAFGRLSVSVNKIAVLAMCNAFGKINYQTLQWHDSIG